MTLRIVAFDVETANPQRTSLCQYAVARFGGDGRIVTDQTLVDPGYDEYFHRRFTEVHGLTRRSVQRSPQPPAVWARMVRALSWGRPVVCHGFAFDRSVAVAVADKWSLDLPDVTWVCSLTLSRRVWPDAPSHSLGPLTEWLGLPGFRHHDASEDVAATLRLVRRAAQEVGCAVDEVWDAVGVSRHGNQPQSARLPT